MVIVVVIISRAAEDKSGGELPSLLLQSHGPALRDHPFSQSRRQLPGCQSLPQLQDRLLLPTSPDCSSPGHLRGDRKANSSQ